MAEGPENDLAVEFGVVGLLISLGPYRGKVGDWGGPANELDPPSPPPEDEGEDLSPSRVNCGFWACVFPGDPTTIPSPVSVFVDVAAKSLFFFRNTLLSLSLSVLGGKGHDFPRKTLAERPIDADEA